MTLQFLLLLMTIIGYHFVMFTDHFTLKIKINLLVIFLALALLPTAPLSAKVNSLPTQTKSLKITKKASSATTIAQKNPIYTKSKSNTAVDDACLTALRISSANNKTRLVFDATRPVKFQISALDQPPRLVLDIPHAYLNNPNLLKKDFNDTPIIAIRNSSLDPNQQSPNLHIYFDLKKTVDFHAFAMDSTADNPRGMRIIVDIASAKNLAKTAPTEAQKAAPSSSLPTAAPSLSAQSNGSDDLPPPADLPVKKDNTSVDQTEKSVTPVATAEKSPPDKDTNMANLIANDNAVPLIKNLKKPSTPKNEIDDTINNNNLADQEIPTSPVMENNKSQRLRDIIIVIDPGHGGHDPGATGLGNTHEKDVVLGISKYLQQNLNHQFGFRALLTRNGDYFITLRDRLKIAHIDHADLFIAIHADAYSNSFARGASVFALSERGATSEAARWLAEKENESELGQAMADKSNLLKSVLIDLAQTASIDTSLGMGSSILHELSQVTSLHRYNVEQAAFVVLKSPDIPSLLIETGFLSNRTEESRLRDAMYQKRVAQALAQGILDYFNQRAPAGTYISVKHNVS